MGGIWFKYLDLERLVLACLSCFTAKNNYIARKEAETWGLADLRGIWRVEDRLGLTCVDEVAWEVHFGDLVHERPIHQPRISEDIDAVIWNLVRQAEYIAGEIQGGFEHFLLLAFGSA